MTNSSHIEPDTETESNLNKSHTISILEQLILKYLGWKHLSIEYASTTSYNVKFDFEHQRQNGSIIIDSDKNEVSEINEGVKGRLFCNICNEYIDPDLTHLQDEHNDIYAETRDEIQNLKFKQFSDLPANLIPVYQEVVIKHLEYVEHRFNYRQLDLINDDSNSFQAGDENSSHLDNIKDPYYHCNHHQDDFWSFELAELHLFIDHQDEFTLPDKL